MRQLPACSMNHISSRIHWSFRALYRVPVVCLAALAIAVIPLEQMQHGDRTAMTYHSGHRLDAWFIRDRCGVLNHSGSPRQRDATYSECPVTRASLHTQHHSPSPSCVADELRRSRQNTSHWRKPEALARQTHTARGTFRLSGKRTKIRELFPPSTLTIKVERNDCRVASQWLVSVLSATCRDSLSFSEPASCTDRPIAFSSAKRYTRSHLRPVRRTLAAYPLLVPEKSVFRTSSSDLNAASANAKSHGAQAPQARPARGTFCLKGRLSNIRKYFSPFNVCCREGTKSLYRCW